MDPRPGAPDPSDDGDARPEDRAGHSDWLPDEDGPFYPWLPPEDRLWRHPSEGSPTPSALEGPRPAPMARRRLVSVSASTVAIALIAGLIGAAAATGVGFAGGLWPHNTTVVRSSTPATSSVSLAALGATATDWTAIDDSIALSVVTVSVDGAAGPEVGSGLVFMQSMDGYTYVVTDRTLFARGLAQGVYGRIEVTFPAGQTVRATLTGADALSGLAVLQMHSPPSGTTAVASLGSVTSLDNADAVLAVGSNSAPSASPGLVSAEDRTVNLADGTDLDGLLAVSMSPLSATATGGPLLNEFGQVIGLTLSLSPVDQADQQFTFAVPMDVVSRVATEMIDGTTLQHPWLGVINATDLPSALAQRMGVYGGVLATQVTPSSPAARAGVRANDVILTLGGKEVYSTGALIAALNQCTPGQAVTITYVHSGRTITTTVHIGNEPVDD